MENADTTTSAKIYVSGDAGLLYKIPINFSSSSVDLQQKLVFFVGGKPYFKFTSDWFYAKLKVGVFPLWVELFKNSIQFDWYNLTFCDDAKWAYNIGHLIFWGEIGFQECDMGIYDLFDTGEVNPTCALKTHYFEEFYTHTIWDQWSDYHYFWKTCHKEEKSYDSYDDAHLLL